jgi:N-methylhydantoinase B/acetone carboxylase alpha subunit
MYYLLDEKTRLAGCHLIREAVERVILEEGVDRFKRFSREVIEEGRRSFKARVREMTVPGRYRSPAFCELTLTDKEALPAQARRDLVMHSPFEVRIGGDGTYELDMDGCSAWGHHSLNCTPSAMQGAIWVQFTQTLICNDKVNDGAYLALRTNFPEGTMSNMGDAGGSTGAAWGFLIPAFTGFPRTLSRALQARGFIEEVLGAYACAGNCYQGGGIDQYGNSSAITHFELAAQGMGAKYVLDGTDHAAAMFNPEGDMGDIEMWELITPIVYLSRRRKASSGGPGRHRGGSSHEALFLHNKTPFWSVQNMGAGRMFTSPGIFGGYPGGLAYVHNVRGADLRERAARGEDYPIADGSFDQPALLELGGEHEYKQDNFTTEQPIADGDLYLLVLRGGSGLGDPLGRPPAAVAEDIAADHLLPRFARSVYGVVLGDAGAVDAEATDVRREEIRRVRLERAVHAREWWAAQRERVLAGELTMRTKVMLAESMRLSPRWAAEYRGFWDLPEDFEFPDAITPTIPHIARAEPGRRTPEEAADEFLASSDVSGGTRTIGAGGALDAETLGALVDERLSRREVKEIQSGYKDADRFEKWVAVLQQRVPYDDPIVLPVGEGLNVVHRSDRSLEIRCDCGHDFCPPERNWKMEAVVNVRDSNESMREVFPQMAHADPEWMELREFQCPSCARQLEVECAPPGYPVVHEFLPDIEGFYRGWLGREVP